MPERLTREEALAFIDAMRLTIEGKVGFKWMTEKLALLAAYVDATACDAETLAAYVDATTGREKFERWAAANRPEEGDS